jgi:hypothetical protein
VPRPADLIDAARRWRQTLPVGARLALNIDAARTRLQIDEMRLTSIDFRFLDWINDDWEPGGEGPPAQARRTGALIELRPHRCQHRQGAGSGAAEADDAEEDTQTGCQTEDVANTVRNV